MSAIPQATTPCTKASKFTLGDKAYTFNREEITPLVKEILIEGMVKNDNDVFYTQNKQLWIKEEHLYKTRKDAYNSLIKQAESEMIE